VSVSETVTIPHVSPSQSGPVVVVVLCTVPVLVVVADWTVLVVVVSVCVSEVVLLDTEEVVE